jgi:hypothetical protein
VRPARAAAWRPARVSYILLATAAVVALGVATVGSLPPSNPGSGPPSVAPVLGVYGVSNASNGGPGCGAAIGEVCFRVSVSAGSPGLLLSELRFELLAPCRCADPANGPPVTLGPGASVAVVGGPAGMVDDWSWSMGSWLEGGGWQLPVDSAVTFVLDTGLRDVSFSGDWFYLVVTGPEADSLGVEL